MVRTLSATLVMMLFATPVLADATDDEAEAHYSSAKQLAGEGKWAEACVQLEKSSALRPRMVTTYRLAECYEHIGKLASAWRKYHAAAEAAKATGEAGKQQEALNYAAKLEARLPRLKIVVASPPKGAVIRRDDEKVPDGELGIAVPLDPGEHHVDVTAPDHKPFHRSVTLGEAQNVTVEVPALVSDAAVPVDESPPPPVTKDPGSKSALGTVGWITAGVGVATAGVGTYLLFSARSRYAEGDDHCPGGLCDREGIDASEDGRSRMRAATMVLVAGGVLVGAGITLVLVAPTSRESPPPVALTVSPNGARFSFTF